jgi:hypothetical protein
LKKEVDRLPQGKLINLPVNGNNDIVWRSMQGVPYGIGSGGKVAHDLEKRHLIPVEEFKMSFNLKKAQK